MAVIKSGASTDELTIDPASKAARVTLYDVNGNALEGTGDADVSVALSALSATATIDMSGHGTCGIVITNTGNAGNVLTVEITLDQLNWVVTPIVNILTNNSTPTITSSGNYAVPLRSGVQQVRVRMSTYVSGTATGNISAVYTQSQHQSIRSFDNVLSVVNSTTSQLNAGATFTGAWEADLYWQGAIVTVYGDQDLLVTFQQSNDGVTVHQSDQFRYRAGNTTNFTSYPFNLTNNYHRVTVQNVGAVATTTMTVSTFACPNFTCEPRLLTPAGNKRIEVPIKDTYRSTFTGTPVATLTFAIKSSSTTKTVRVNKIGFSQSGTSTSYIDVTINRYSSVATGTPVACTAGVVDTPNGGGFVALVYNYTVTPGTQTVSGILHSQRYLVNKSADNVAPQYIEVEFGNSQRGTGAATIRNTTDYIGISISALTAGSAANMFVEWTED